MTSSSLTWQMASQVLLWLHNCKNMGLLLCASLFTCSAFVISLPTFSSAYCLMMPASIQVHAGPLSVYACGYACAWLPCAAVCNELNNSICSFTHAVSTMTRTLYALLGAYRIVFLREFPALKMNEHVKWKVVRPQHRSMRLDYHDITNKGNGVDWCMCWVCARGSFILEHSNHKCSVAPLSLRLRGAVGILNLVDPSSSVSQQFINLNYNLWSSTFT